MRPLLLVLLPLVLASSTIGPSARASTFLERPLWTGIGAAGGGTAAGPGGAGYLHVTLGLRLIPVVPELTLREGIASGPRRHATSIAAGARFLLPRLLGLRGFLRVGFSHQHELAWEAFEAAPARALLGVHERIAHRSGFETGGGLELSLGPRGILGLWLQGTAIVLPDAGGPVLTVLAEGGLSVAIGPRRTP